jgi:hypothetical protein
MGSGEDAEPEGDGEGMKKNSEKIRRIRKKYVSLRK